MTTLLIISFALLVSYITGVSLWKKELPEAITDTAKWLSWPWKSLWFIFTLLAIGLAAPAVIDAAGNSVKWVSFIALASATIASACQFNQGGDVVDVTLQRTGKILFILSATAVVVLSPTWWLIFMWLTFIPLFIWKRDNLEFFVGCIAILGVYLTALINN